MLKLSFKIGLGIMDGTRANAIVERERIALLTVDFRLTVGYLLESQGQPNFLGES